MTYLMWWPALISQRRLWTESTWTSYSPASTISLESLSRLECFLLLVWRCNPGWALQPWPSPVSQSSALPYSSNFIASQPERSLKRRSTKRPWRQWKWRWGIPKGWPTRMIPSQVSPLRSSPWGTSPKSTKFILPVSLYSRMWYYIVTTDCDIFVKETIFSSLPLWLLSSAFAPSFPGDRCKDQHQWKSIYRPCHARGSCYSLQKGG